MLFLLMSACSSREGSPLKLEACRKTTEGREEIVYVMVDRVRLTGAGVSEEEPRKLVRSSLGAVGEVIAEAGAGALGASPSDSWSRKKEDPVPAWVAPVFPSGIPVEVVITERDGSKKTQSLVLPLAPSR